MSGQIFIIHPFFILLAGLIVTLLLFLFAKRSSKFIYILILAVTQGMALKVITLLPESIWLDGSAKIWYFWIILCGIVWVIYLIFSPVVQIREMPWFQIAQIICVSIPLAQNALIWLLFLFAFSLLFAYWFEFTSTDKTKFYLYASFSIFLFSFFITLLVIFNRQNIFWSVGQFSPIVYKGFFILVFLICIQGLGFPFSKWLANIYMSKNNEIKFYLATIYQLFFLGLIYNLLQADVSFPIYWPGIIFAIASLGGMYSVKKYYFKIGYLGMLYFSYYLLAFPSPWKVILGGSFILAFSVLWTILILSKENKFLIIGLLYIITGLLGPGLILKYFILLLYPVGQQLVLIALFCLELVFVIHLSRQIYIRPQNRRKLNNTLQ